MCSKVPASVHRFNAEHPLGPLMLGLHPACSIKYFAMFRFLDSTAIYSAVLPFVSEPLSLTYSTIFAISSEVTLSLFFLITSFEKLLISNTCPLSISADASGLIPLTFSNINCTTPVLSFAELAA
ncbi:hypothetical protein ANAPRD1_00876 [Anaplasma phagocytophilum]|nr:hypothetical protein ANAPRD1_00876 [Anaplasma phagocytophilum]